MRKLFVAITVASTLVASIASAFDPADLKTLKETNECIECDLTLIDLSDENLSGANLSKTDLTNAYLVGANLSNTKLA